jgi:hypothetical protein
MQLRHKLTETKPNNRRLYHIFFKMFCTLLHHFLFITTFKKILLGICINEKLETDFFMEMKYNEKLTAHFIW